MRSKLAASAESSAPLETIQDSQQPSFKQTLFKWLHLNTFGGRLFWMIMLSALTGVGGMALLFSEMMKYQAEDQVRRTLDGQVNAISSVTAAAETLANGLGISATTLHERQAQYADTYRELTLQLFETRPEFVVGLGLGQRENGLVVNQPWLFPYYTDSGQPSISYEDLADDEGEFYPESQRYRDYFVPQTNIWTEPYQTDTNQLLTYYLPLFSGDGRWLGTALVDVDSQYLSQLIDRPVFRQMGHFVLITREGNVIANPTNVENTLETYRDIPDLSDLWQQIGSEATGFLEGETGYWSYAAVPDHDWLVVGYVPYGAVFNRVALITLAASALIVALLSTAIILAVRNLNRRLKPVLNQCNQLAQADSMLLAQWHDEDDLSQLSLAFFNMLEQLNLNEETIRRHEQKIATETSHADQISEQFVEFTKLLERMASKQQALIRDVQYLMAEVASSSQTVDTQMDAISTLGRALDGELRRVPNHGAETLALVEQQVSSLGAVLNHDFQVDQLRVLADQLAKNVLTLKAIEQRRPAVESLQQQTGNIAQASQAAAVESNSTLTAVQSIEQMLTEIERISTTVLKRARAVKAD